MRGLTARILDPMAEAGGQLSALYPDKYIYDVAGFPKIRAKDLVRNPLEQVEPFDPIFFSEEHAETLAPQEDGSFLVTTSAGRSYRSRAVIITAGVGAFEPRRLDAEGVDRLEHKGLEYAVRNAEAYRGKRVLIIGGGDSAVDWALTLKDLAAHVSLIHRRGTFRAHGATVNRLIAAAEAGELELLTPYELKAVLGEEEVREAVIVHSRPAKSVAWTWTPFWRSPATSRGWARSPTEGSNSKRTASRPTRAWKPAFPASSPPGTSPPTRARSG